MPRPQLREHDDQADHSAQRRLAAVRDRFSADAPPSDGQSLLGSATTAAPEQTNFWKRNEFVATMSSRQMP